MLYKVIFIVVIFGALAYIDIPGIIKNKKWRELTFYSAFLLLGFAIMLLHEVSEMDFSVFTRWMIMAFSN